MNAEKMLIIGGTGFIGSQVARAAHSNFEVLLAARHPVDCEQRIPNAKTVRADLLDPKSLINYLDYADFIIDCSGSTQHDLGYPTGLSPVLETLSAYDELLRLVSKAKVKKFVFVSSGGTIYRDSIVSNAEDSPLLPCTPYALLKVMVEHLGFHHHRTLGVPFVSVRPSNPYGPDQIRGDGPGFIGRCLFCATNSLPLKVTGIGESIRDYLPVSELADGILKACLFGRVGEAYNLGSEVGYSTRHVLYTINKLLSEIGITPLAPVFVPRGDAELMCNVLDCNKAADHLGWRSKVPLEYGIKVLIQNYLSKGISL